MKFISEQQTQAQRNHRYHDRTEACDDNQQQRSDPLPHHQWQIDQEQCQNTDSEEYVSQGMRESDNDHPGGACPQSPTDTILQPPVQKVKRWNNEDKTE